MYCRDLGTQTQDQEEDSKVPDNFQELPSPECATQTLSENIHEDARRDLEDLRVRPLHFTNEETRPENGGDWLKVKQLGDPAEERTQR